MDNHSLASFVLTIWGAWTITTLLAAIKSYERPIWAENNTHLFILRWSHFFWFPVVWLARQFHK